MDLTTPWARFFDATRASATVAKIGQHADRLHGTRKGKPIELSPRITAAIETLVGQCSDAAVVLADLALWVDIGVLQAVADVVNRSSGAEGGADVNITLAGMGKLFDSKSISTGNLIEALVLAYPSAASALSKLVTDRHSEISGRTDLLPAIRPLLDLPQALDLALCGSALAQSAEVALSGASAASESDAAVDILGRLAKRNLITSVAVITFGKAHARLAKNLADAGDQTVVRGILEDGLKRAIGICADTTPLTAEQIELLVALGKSPCLAGTEYR